MNECFRAFEPKDGIVRELRDLRVQIVVTIVRIRGHITFAFVDTSRLHTSRCIRADEEGKRDGGCTRRRVETSPRYELQRKVL